MKNKFSPTFKLGVSVLVFTAFVVLAPETSANFMDTIKGWFGSKEKTTKEMTDQTSPDPEGSKNESTSSETMMTEEKKEAVIEESKKEELKTEEPKTEEKTESSGLSAFPELSTEEKKASDADYLSDLLGDKTDLNTPEIKAETVESTETPSSEEKTKVEEILEKVGEPEASESLENPESEAA